MAENKTRPTDASVEDYIASRAKTTSPRGPTSSKAPTAER